MSDQEMEILLIEDNPNDAEMTVDALNGKNLANNIKILTDGEMALNYIFGKGKYSKRDTSFAPKLILLDLKLPKINGIELLKELKTNESTRTIPVVVLSSSSEEKDLIESYKLGVNSYIVKPVDFDQFMKAVSEIGLYWLLLNKSIDWGI